MLKKVFFFFFSMKIFVHNEIINIPFHTKEETINSEDIYTSTQLKNSEIIKIEIGEPKKEIPIIIKFNEFSFFISGKLVPENKYNEENSKTFNSNNKTKFTCSDNLANIGYRANETFYLKNTKNNIIKYDNIGFILATNIIRDDNCVLGLKIIKKDQRKEDNFINELKSKKIINNYIWTLKYNKENDKIGEFIIGDYPHIYDKYNYNKDFLKISKIENSASKFNEWIIKFDEINFNEKKINVRNVKLEVEFGLIKAPMNYHEIFYNNIFLNCYYDTNECKQIDLDLQYFSYVFNKKYDVSKFPNITFVHKEFQYNFTLTYKDLFKEYNGKYYFLIVFLRNHNHEWVFGKIFLKKYQFIFDPENRLIGFYNQKITFQNNSYLIWVIIFSLIIFIILLIFFYTCCFKKKRKIRNNEIEDGYDYSTNENGENKLYFSL